jgi:hypothetical protein
MANPDSSDGSFGYGVSCGVIIIILVIAFFNFFSQSSYFPVILYLVIPLLIYIITSTINIIGQQSTCNSIDIGKALLYGLPSIGLTFLGLLISAISWCRIPVVSVFASLFVDKSNMPIRNSSKNSGVNSRMCCGQQLTLEIAEEVAPTLKGMAYSFYLFFTTLFGIIIGMGFSVVC